MDKMIEAMTRNVEAFCEAIDGNRLPDDVELTAPQVSTLTMSLSNSVARSLRKSLMRWVFSGELVTLSRM